MNHTSSHAGAVTEESIALDTYEAILAAFPVADLVRALDLADEGHARVLRHRRRIPVRYWPDVVTLAAQLGVAVGPDNLGRAEFAFQLGQRREPSAKSTDRGAA